MLISNSYNTHISGIDVLDLDFNKRYKKVQSEATPSGDTISISDEAKQLYSKMIHKYDHPSTTNEGEEGATCDKQSSSQGSGGSSGSSDSVEKLKNQIQSLKSQLAAVASQVGNGADSAAMSKMNSLQAQIAALEAQLDEMQQAG